MDSSSDGRTALEEWRLEEWHQNSRSRTPPRSVRGGPRLGTGVRATTTSASKQVLRGGEHLDAGPDAGAPAARSTCERRGRAAACCGRPRTPRSSSAPARPSRHARRRSAPAASPGGAAPGARGRPSSAGSSGKLRHARVREGVAGGERGPRPEAHLGLGLDAARAHPADVAPLARDRGPASSRPSRSRSRRAPRDEKPVSAQRRPGRASGPHAGLAAPQPLRAERGVREGQRVADAGTSGRAR